MTASGWFAGTLVVVDPDDLPELAAAWRQGSRTRVVVVECRRRHAVVTVWRTAVGLVALGEDMQTVPPLPGAEQVPRHRAVVWSAVLEHQADSAVAVAQCRCSRHEVPVDEVRAAVASGRRRVRVARAGW